MRKIFTLVFFLVFDIIIIYIVFFNLIELFKLMSKKNLLELLYSIFGLIIFLRSQLIFFNKK